MTTIPTPTLDQIVIEAGTQMREIVSDVVDEYASAMQAGAAFPPIDVFFDGERYILAHGFHRFSAYQKCPETIPVIKLHEGTERDAILFAVMCPSNSKHGLRTTNEEKRTKVLTLLKDSEWAKWSNRVIAEKCGVSHKMVNEVRNSLEPGSSDKKQDTTRTYVNRHGKTGEMEVGNIGKKDEVTGGAEAPGKAGKPGKPGKKTTGGAAGKPAGKKGAEPAEDAWKAKLEAAEDKRKKAEEKLAEAQEQVAAVKKKASDREAEFSEVLDTVKRDDDYKDQRIRNLEATVKADDAKAHHLSMIIRMEHAERRAQELMDSAAQADKRAKFFEHHLARVGKAIGERDLDNIAATVEAIMRRVKAKDPSLLEAPAEKGNGAAKVRRAAA